MSERGTHAQHGRSQGSDEAREVDAVVFALIPEYGQVKVSVSARHLEPQSVAANDCVHQEVRWTRWKWKESSRADGTVRS